MSHSTWIPATRRLVALPALVMAMSAGAPLLAQQPAPRPFAAPSQAAAPQAPAGKTLELTMDQAVSMALEANLDLKTDKFNLAISAQGIAAARAAYLPTLTAGLSRNSSTSVPINQFETTASKTVSNSLSGSSRWAQALPWHGASYSLNWNAGRTASNRISSFNPSLSSGITASFNQPLLQRFAIDSNRYTLENSQRTYQISDLQLQQQIVSIQDNVRLAYLRLVGAVAGLGVARDNQNVNEVALRNARARIAVGNAAEIDAIQSEAAVRSSEEFVILAEASVASAEDLLRSLVLDPNRADYWQVHLVATDEIVVTPRQIDVDAAIKNALANRLDLIVARQQIEQVQLGQRLNEDSTKPAVDFNAVYAATGAGGTPIDSTTGLPLQSIGFSSALGDAFGNRNPSWTFGVNVAYPIGQTSAKVALARTQLQLDQQQVNLRSQELQVVAQVRDAARQVEAGYRRVQSTQLALTANEQQLRAEERKQAVGMSSQFDVLQKQQLLASAKSAELNARIAYNQAILAFDRVQKIR